MRRWLAVPAVVLLVALAALAIRSNAVLGERVGPSCSVGLVGSSVIVTVRGWDALHVCAMSRHVYHYSDADAPPSEPSVCQVEVQGELYTVHDTGLQLIGQEVCGALRQKGGLSGTSGG